MINFGKKIITPRKKKVENPNFVCKVNFLVNRTFEVLVIRRFVILHFSEPAGEKLKGSNRKMSL